MIPHNRPTLGAQEERAAARALQSGWLARGPETKAFECELAAFLGIEPANVVATSSGTSALYLALWALSARGKTIAIPGYACAAVRNAVLMAGGTPNIVDTAPGSPNASIQEVLASKSDIAVIAHMYGIPEDVCSAAKVMPVIEDCAQSFGARVNGAFAGLSGTVGVTSFYATKLLTTGGQGGAVFSRKRGIIEEIRDYLDFDCRRDGLPRFNFEITDVQSAVGRVQLSRYAEFLERRRSIFEQYKTSGANLLDAASPALEPVRYRAVARIRRPERFIAELQAAGVTAIVPTAKWELPSSHALPNARALAGSTVSLPLYPTLSDDEVRLIGKSIRAAVHQQ